MSKSETKPNKSKKTMTKTAQFRVSGFLHSDFGFVSDFEIRISDFRRRRSGRLLRIGCVSQLERVERVDEIVQIVLRLRVLVFLALRQPDRRADCLPAVGDQLAVAVLDSLRQRVRFGP